MPLCIILYRTLGLTGSSNHLVLRLEHEIRIRRPIGEGWGVHTTRPAGIACALASAEVVLPMIAVCSNTAPLRTFEYMLRDTYYTVANTPILLRGKYTER